MARRTYFLPLLLVFTCAAKKPKKGAAPPPPPVGWYTQEGWTGECYNPPDFAALGTVDRRSGRDEALRAMMEQWSGRHGGSPSFESTHVDAVETVLLGTPEKIEIAASENHAECVKAMAGGGTDAWGSWLKGLPARMLKGVCRRPLDDMMFWYLDLGSGWQFQASICDDDVVEITATESDKYRVDDGTDWIDVNGDRSKPATGPDYPCNLEGCYAGQLIMRFRGESGAVVIKPVNGRLVFDPPEHGSIEITVNDTSYFNNVFRIQGGLQDRTGVTYTPLD